jgi:Uma2 family endonuclease
MAVTQLVTAEQFWDMPDIPGKQRELVRGEVIEMPTPGAIHNVIANLLQYLLRVFATERRLGLVFGDNMGYLLNRGPDTVRVPDVSFIAWEHVPDSGIPEGAWLMPPDLAVEVVSPTDQPADVQNKARDYIESGVRLVWVVWPKRQAVSVYTREAATYELGPDAELDGGDVLPGFHVRVGDLFEIPMKPTS